MIPIKRLPICAAAALAPGEAIEFTAHVRGEPRPCFALRLDRPGAHFVAYVNICAHRNQPVVIDRRPVDADGLVECRAHGARYEAESGRCVDGPCEGARLIPSAIEVIGDELFAVEDDTVDDSLYADEE